MRHRTLLLGLILASLLVTPAWGQQTQSRSEVEFWPVGAAPEIAYRPWGLYNTNFTIELGGQLVDVDGNDEVYESQLNYRDGFKVFSFDIQGKGAGDAFFTGFYLRGGGWVNEPYSWAHFGFSKDRWFDFRGSFRESEYNWFFPGFARTQHFNDTERRFQDYRLTLLPKRKFRGKLGYSRNSSFGPTFTTFDFSRGEFPVFEPLGQTYDEYSLGVEGNISRWLLSFEYGYRFFRNDRFLTTREDLDTPVLPNDPADAARVNEWERLMPSRGRTPFYRLNIVGRPHDRVEVNARVVYSEADSDYTRLESLDGQTFAQGAANPSTAITFEHIAFGEITRPMTTLDGNITWRPVRRLTITNNFQYHGYDIAGFNDEVRAIECANPATAGCPLTTTTSTFAVRNHFENSFFDLDSVQNRFEARYEVAKWLTLRGGFNYLDRTWNFFEFGEQAEDGTIVSTDEHTERVDALNRAWLAGAMIRPNKRVQIFFDLENGNFTRVFNRQAPADLDRYRLRGRFEPWDGIRFNASWFIFDNQNFKAPIPDPAVVNLAATNPVRLACEASDFTDPGCALPGRHSSRNRGVAFDFQLARFERGYINAGYSRNDQTATTDVTIPAPPFTAGVFVYELNENYFYVDGGGRVAGKLYVDAGYRIVDSSGSFPPSDPVGACDPFALQSCDGSLLDPFEIFSGGLKYHQPHVAVRYAFNDNVSWKFGWRYYKYDQEVGTFSDYKSHVLTTSVVLSF